MSRRHAVRFRPSGPEPMEGRLAPGSILPGGPHARAAVVRTTRPAHPAPKPKTTTVTIDWNKINDNLNKVGDQIRDFFGGGHKAAPPHRVAHPQAVHASSPFVRR